MDSLELFDICPKERFGEIERTEIEYLQLAFGDDKKKRMILMMEKIIHNYDNHSDLLFNLVEKEYEKNNSKI
jgi:hypothetical protein|tara:strand:- start:2557 stop:2772 length:216 start_codon:yes stop_codon:yes gene_type:complete